MDVRNQWVHRCMNIWMQHGVRDVTMSYAKSWTHGTMVITSTFRRGNGYKRRSDNLSVVVTAGSSVGCIKWWAKKRKKYMPKTGWFSMVAQNSPGPSSHLGPTHPRHTKRISPCLAKAERNNLSGWKWTRNFQHIDEIRLRRLPTGGLPYERPRATRALWLRKTTNSFRLL